MKCKTRPDTPISLGGFFGPETGKYSATDQRDFEFVSGHDCAGIFANPCNPWEIRVTGLFDFWLQVAYNYPTASNLQTLPSPWVAHMATRIEAIHAYRPRLVLSPTAKLDQVVDFIVTRIGANKGTVWA